MKIFRRLINSAILNPMIICSVSLPGMNTDHIKFRVDLVQVLLEEYESKIRRKVPARHSMTRTVSQLTGSFQKKLCQKRNHGQQRGVLCAINKTRGRI
jgi:hypothetical protein